MALLVLCRVYCSSCIFLEFLIACVEMVFFIHMYRKSVFANWLVLHCCGLQCGLLCVFSRELSHLHA